MPEAAQTFFPLEAADLSFAPLPEPGSDDYVAAAAARFCADRPYALAPYSKRNWGGQVHSLCSYQGKLKPSIAHFLVSWFTRPGETILDPMSGVGTIPLEARLQGRLALAGDMSDLAVAVSRAKVEVVGEQATWDVVARLRDWLGRHDGDPLPDLIAQEGADFGLNGPIQDYFHPKTLREVLLARRFFAAEVSHEDPSVAFVLTAILHILHGNRPYALSRRSHPITPLRPTGCSTYRPLVGHLERRLHKTLPDVTGMPGRGIATQADFASLPFPPNSIDAVVTSPPFARSLRFWSSNWMRLWFCGWDANDFRSRPAVFLESEQKRDFQAAYRRFFDSMHPLLAPNGLLIMHLGATREFDMTQELLPLLEPNFRMVYAGTEHLDGPESHGLTDKGTTLQHQFIFCRRV